MREREREREIERKNPESRLSHRFFTASPFFEEGMGGEGVVELTRKVSDCERGTREGEREKAPRSFILIEVKGLWNTGTFSISTVLRV